MYSVTAQRLVYMHVHVHVHVWSRTSNSATDSIIELNIINIETFPITQFSV